LSIITHLLLGSFSHFNYFSMYIGIVWKVKFVALQWYANDLYTEDKINQLLYIYMHELTISA
jgi:hypothetical protein